uniref:Ubiquitin-like protease family profile domain-containing protein n=1 Tax=Brassica oleracea TaxID=3712 RepID=A0A3P6ENI2_BRAOL|nr:unnamed protein product [Brassica oleracea]
MFVGGIQGSAASVVPPSRVVKKAKRKVNVRVVEESAETSKSKKSKLRSAQARSGQVDPPAKLLAAVSSEIRAGLKESQAAGGVVVEEEVAALVQEKPPTAVYSTTVKFKKLISNIDADTLVDFSNGLVLKGNELLAISSIIPRLIRRESLFKNINPANDPRADMLPCRFYGAFAAEYSKFKKCRRQEGFAFNSDLVNSVTVRCDELGKEWLKDIDYLYSPFNIDKNQCVGLVVDLRLRTLTVFDCTASARRASRLKPQLEFICEMFP